MEEIKCPNCGTVFQINESDYESIVKQVRDSLFKQELKNMEDRYKREKEDALKLSEANLEKAFKEEVSKKDMEINDLKNELKRQDTLKELAVNNAILSKDKTIDSLKNKLELDKSEYLLKEKNLIESYEDKIKSRDEQILYYKDFKARQSTKMIGESLEQHCSCEFNKLRPLFKNAYFEKDNDVKTGSKGDFIFRDYDDDGTLIVSIMFEMKNEADATLSKHKNEDFFKELDKDRKEKECEYAVLVSLLEIDSDYYNSGIVDVSHKYDKMYVIRPQFFIPLITLIRNLALNSLAYKKELQTIRNQNIDISNFEENMNNFKEGFERNYKLASERFNKAILEIDKTIEHLLKTKDALLSSENNLRLANSKAADLTIKKLTHNSETMAVLFEEERKKKKSETLV